jgi:glutamate dehydrogenase/leucine dehydrogenase
MGTGGHEQVAFCHDSASGLRAIIAIWSTALGPSLGGCRFQPYPTEADALRDVLRLSRAMGYKNAAAGLDLGGGKAVIIGDPRTDKTESRLRAFGRFIDSLGGRYLTAEDVGTTQADMDMIRRETPYVTGVSARRGGSGDPSPVTAVGVFEAMRAAAATTWGSRTLTGRHVAVQGVGKVGGALARILHDEGARLTVADVAGDAAAAVAASLEAAVVPPEKIHAVACDIYAPCALGGVINTRTIHDLQCQIVCGAANNQLEDDGMAAELETRGIVYVPDFVANAGGVINIAVELEGYDPVLAEQRVRGIYDTTTAILDRARTDHITPLAAAARQAESRIESVARLSRIRSTRVRRSR